MIVPPHSNEDQDALSRLSDLVLRASAENPTPENVQNFRNLLAAAPGLWRIAGDLAAIAQKSMIETVCPQVFVRESVLQGARELRSELTRPDDTALEKLVVEQCVTAHLLYYSIQAQYNILHQQGCSIETAYYWEQRLNAAQRRLLRAVESLSRVRRLSQPSTQINIAKHQTNINSLPAPRDEPD